MSATAEGHEDLDGGRIWIAFEVVTLVVAAAMFLIAVGLLVSDAEVTVRPGEALVGSRTYAVEGDGNLVVQRCPSPVDALQEEGSTLCRDDTRTIAVSAVAVGEVRSSSLACSRLPAGSGED